MPVNAKNSNWHGSYNRIAMEFAPATMHLLRAQSAEGQDVLGGRVGELAWGNEAHFYNLDQ
jgi:hypothetical protein